MGKTRRYLTIIFTLALAAIFCITGTAAGRTRGEHRKQEQQYRTLEQEYVERVKAYLDTNGYKNSGVMVTRVVEADGSREYTVTVHNGLLDSLSEEKQEELQSGLEALSFDKSECRFSHIFPDWET